MKIEQEVLPEITQVVVHPNGEVCDARVNPFDAEDCQACAELEVRPCNFHIGVEVGYGYAVEKVLSTLLILPDDQEDSNEV